MSKKTKIIQKRTSIWQKLAYILKPFVIYMVLKTAAMLTLMLVVTSLPLSGINAWIGDNSNQISAVINAAASIVAVCFLINDFLIEVNISGEVDIDKKIFGQFFSFLKSGFWGTGKSFKENITGLSVCVVIGVVSSYAFNKIITLVSQMIQKQSLGSEKYTEVETIQYSVPIWLGLILYGIIAPLVEEIVFRGITYNRIKKFYGVTKAVIASSILFGLFHANLPQFIYGSIMGMIIAICYERIKCFAAPVLVHMAANIFVFTLTV